MTKSRSILFLIFLQYVYAVLAENKSQSYDPLMKFFCDIDPKLKTFPFKEIRQRENEIVQKYLCPPENEENVAKIEKVSKLDYKVKYCLFEKKFLGNEDRICKREVRFVFHKTTNRPRDGVCGSMPYQTLHTFSYYDCGQLSNVDYLEDMISENGRETRGTKGSLVFQHEMCYDTVEKSVLWTKHYIRTPQLFQNPQFKNQQPLPVAEISTESYFIDDDSFLILKNQYEMEKQKNASEPGTFIMLPQPLVSPDHYALPIMKKSTNHVINMAPLWENLVPLMNAINERIKQAQIISESSDPKLYDPFIIQTKVTLPREVEKISNTRISLQLFQGNIWQKLVWQKKMKTAVLITIHNTPGNPPAKERRCIVGKDKKCNFQAWTKGENLSGRITLDDTKYASCCEVTSDDLKSIFSDDFVIIKYLNIDRI